MSEVLHAACRGVEGSMSAADAGATSAKLIDYTEAERPCRRLVEATSTTDSDEGEGAVADG